MALSVQSREEDPDDPTECAVRRAIAAMHENLGEQLTVDDLARAARFSKFHFSRVFQQRTGVSPGRFLSALRIQHAKRLLVSTALSVADVSAAVGYHSVGTFSSRFTRSVGMPPSVYRRLAGYAPEVAPATSGADPPGTRVSGWARTPPSHAHSPVFIGFFPDRIPEGRPVRCAVLPHPGRYQLDGVPPGTWYALAQAARGDTPPSAHPAAVDPEVCVATHGPLTVRPDTVMHVDLELKPTHTLDPPVLLALQDARRLALARVAAAADRTAA